MAKKDTTTGPSYTPTTWTKNVNGVDRERTATSVEDEVKYRFDGWLPKGQSAAVAERNAAAAAASTGADVAAGSKSTSK